MVALVLAGCSAAPTMPTTPTPTPTTPTSPTSPVMTPTTAAVTPAPTPTRAATPSLTTSTPSPQQDLAARTLASLTLEQRVGQLFMVGGSATGVGRATRTAITTHHVGNVMLTGRSSRGVRATARVSAGVRQLATKSATGGVPLLVATDQEGGAVQVLRGEGFSDMPSAVVQGRWSPKTLQTRAAGWGRELRAAGVDLNLAPVADTVSAATAGRNAPIGRFDRQLGSTPDDVAAQVLAFDAGMREAGVLPVVKHFPGLGRVRGNTDVSSGVTDRETTRTHDDLRPFAQAIDADVPFVMMSTAVYARIDADHPAAFSPVVIRELLREQLGFSGVVISDDLGSARQVADVPAGRRAVRFVAAGGDLVLTVDPTVLPTMVRAVLEQARTDARFRAQVDEAAVRVLTAKAAQGLLG